MDIRLYNTLSKKEEVFKPIEKDKVKMYHCGPTVYDRAHVGNLRTYVFSDILRRLFEYNSYEVIQTINITDVGHLTSNMDDGDDKMSKALKREGKPMTLESMREIGQKYTDIFLNDLEEIKIKTPNHIPKASDHIREDIEIIKLLEDKGFVYKIPDGIYFNTSKLPEYGKLGGINREEETISNTRVDSSQKKSSADFALWKFDQNIGWDSPWGKGFPGWHIECSAMARRYLGQPFDIHTGGVDHIPVHHNNEIAQSECAYDVPLANIWMHSAFLTIDHQKMAKSEGNFVDLDTLKDNNISPIAYRYWLLTAHYRSPADFTLKAVSGAQNALVRLMTVVGGYPSGGDISEAYKERFMALINRDLDTPKALALAWELIKDLHISPADKRATIIDFDKIFGFGLDSIPNIESADTHDAPPDIIALAETRLDARKNKDWQKSDALRIEISERGYDIIDENDGFKIVKKNNIL